MFMFMLAAQTLINFEERRVAGEKAAKTTAAMEYAATKASENLRDQEANAQTLKTLQHVLADADSRASQTVEGSVLVVELITEREVQLQRLLTTEKLFKKLIKSIKRADKHQARIPIVLSKRVIISFLYIYTVSNKLNCLALTNTRIGSVSRSSPSRTATRRRWSSVQRLPLFLRL